MAPPNAALHCDTSLIGGRGVSGALVDRAEALSAVLSLVADNSHHVERAADIIVEALASGHSVLVCGNGGSAAEAQHLAGELVGRFRREREPWPVLALTADSAVLTAVANDYGYETVFERQVAAFGHQGDVLVGISTSGESPNVVKAACQARERGMSVIALTGREPTRLGFFSAVAIAVPATETALVQEIHSVLVHLISEIVESRLAQQNIERRPVDAASALSCPGRDAGRAPALPLAPRRSRPLPGNRTVAAHVPDIRLGAGRRHEPIRDRPRLLHG